MDYRNLRNITAAIILVHLIVSMIHGYAHTQALVTLSAVGQIYVIVVIILAPLLGGALLYSRRLKTGALLAALSLAGSFVFGLVYHFLLPGSDNVMEVHGEWHMMFMWTAVMLAVLELVGTLTAFWLYHSLSRSLQANR
ncbi:MAG TPA: hypothetical protein VKB46_15340 [Pyrinomonadaceae bacterium]|nr:hypothetical protein [Pyrinomonadaceae bacterium]